MELTLKPGEYYLFDHVRKGKFYGEFKGMVPNNDDDQDDQFIEVDVYTEDGSGQERLANVFVRDEAGNKVRPTFSRKQVRPSLINSITQVDKGEMQRLKSIPKPEAFTAAPPTLNIVERPIQIVEGGKGLDKQKLIMIITIVAGAIVEVIRQLS